MVVADLGVPAVRRTRRGSRPPRTTLSRAPRGHSCEPRDSGLSLRESPQKTRVRGGQPPRHAQRRESTSSQIKRLWSGGELAVHAEGAVELAGEDEGAGGGDGHLDLDRFLGQDVAIELARDGDVVQRAGLVLDAEAQTLPRFAAQESGAEIVVICFHLHHTKRADVTRAVIGKGDAADGERLRLGARGRG